MLRTDEITTTQNQDTPRDGEKFENVDKFDTSALQIGKEISNFCAVIKNPATSGFADNATLLAQLDESGCDSGAAEKRIAASAEELGNLWKEAASAPEAERKAKFADVNRRIAEQVKQALSEGGGADAIAKLERGMNDQLKGVPGGPVLSYDAENSRLTIHHVRPATDEERTSLESLRNNGKTIRELLAEGYILSRNEQTREEQIDYVPQVKSETLDVHQPFGKQIIEAGEKVKALKERMDKDDPKASKELQLMLRTMPDGDRAELAQWLKRNGMPHAGYKPGFFKVDDRQAPFQGSDSVVLNIPKYLEEDLQKKCTEISKLLGKDKLSDADKQRIGKIFQGLKESDRYSLAENIDSLMPQDGEFQYEKDFGIGVRPERLNIKRSDGKKDTINVPYTKEQEVQLAAEQKEAREKRLADKGAEARAKKYEKIANELIDIIAKDSFGTAEEQKRIIKAIQEAEVPEELVDAISAKLSNGRTLTLDKVPSLGQGKDILALSRWSTDVDGNPVTFKWRKELEIPRVRKNPKR